MKRLIFLVAAVLLALLPQLRAAGASTSLSARGAADISSYLREAIAHGDVPGVVALVTTRDRVVYEEAFGTLDRARNVPMSTNDIFNIASMTKPITSVAVMQLVEAGKLHLDDDAAKYLPNLARLQVLTNVDLKAGTWKTRPARGPITIKALLTHTSGVGYSFSDPGLALVASKTKLADGDLPLVADPGTRWTYGASTKLLGDIVEKVSGRTLDDYVDHAILSPLGMRATSYAVAPANRARVASVYQHQGGTWVERPSPPVPPVTVRGDGGLYSTAEDYARFIRMMLNGGTVGRTRIIGAQTVRDMTTNEIGSLVVPLQPTANASVSKPFPLGAGRDKWGLGFLLETASDGHSRSVGSYSWAGIYNTEFWIDPQKQVGAVLLMQTLPFYDENAIEVLKGFETRVYRAIASASGT